MKKKPYEAVRIEPISIGWGTGLNLGGAMGATAQGGAVDITKGIGDFTILVGAHVGATASATGVTATAANYVQFSVYEATAATHAGSAISGATLTLGAATAAKLRGAYDAFLRISSLLTTTENITINGFSYHTTLTGPGRDGTAVAAELASAINGFSGGTAMPKLPHYKAYSATGIFAGTSGVIYIAPEDDQATGLTILMASADATIVTYMSRLQGKIDINGHALSSNTPKWINVVNTTFNGGTGCFYAFLLRNGNQTPGRLVELNT